MIDLYTLHRRVKQLLTLESTAWHLAQKTYDVVRKDRLLALSFRANVRADNLQHKIIAAGRS